MPPGEYANPNGVVTLDPVGGEQPVDVVGTERPDHQLGEHGAPSRCRAPGDIRSAAAHQQRGDVVREGRDELVADPTVQQVEPLETIDHHHVDAGVGDLPGGCRGRRRRGSSQPGSQGGERSGNRRLHVAPSTPTHFIGKPASVPATRAVLPIPPGPCTNTAAGPRGARRAASRERSLTRPTSAEAAPVSRRSETEPPGPGWLVEASYAQVAIRS
jgi:hypothetical protein